MESIIIYYSYRFTSCLYENNFVLAKYYSNNYVCKLTICSLYAIMITIRQRHNDKDEIENGFLIFDLMKKDTKVIHWLELLQRLQFSKI